MSTSVIRRCCPACGQMRPFEKQRVNHILHLLLSLVTVGLWLPIWLLLVILKAASPFRCRDCGRAAYM